MVVLLSLLLPMVVGCVDLLNYCSEEQERKDYIKDRKELYESRGLPAGKASDKAERDYERQRPDNDF